MSPQDRMRVAAAAGCSLPTLDSFIKGNRKTTFAIAHAIEVAMRGLGLWDAFSERRALERAATVPACPHEAEG